MTKSTQSIATDSTPESQPVDSTLERLENLEFMLDLMIQRRKSLGEYNADAGDILALAHGLRVVIQSLRGKL